MSGHATPGELCTDACQHICPACRIGEPCVDLFEDPIAGVIACTNNLGAVMTAYILTRDVTRDECWWLPVETVPVGAVVYRCAKPTYGAVKDFPATFDPTGDYPFFELPHDAIRASS